MSADLPIEGQTDLMQATWCGWLAGFVAITLQPNKLRVRAKKLRNVKERSRISSGTRNRTLVVEERRTFSKFI